MLVDLRSHLGNHLRSMSRNSSRRWAEEFFASREVALSPQQSQVAGVAACFFLNLRHGLCCVFNLGISQATERSPG